MTLKQLKYLMEIARCGSLSEAAKTFGVSQPSLSSAVKELETEFQIELLTRTNRGIGLSSDGEEFLKYARAVLNQSERLEKRFTEGEKPDASFNAASEFFWFSAQAFGEVLKGQCFAGGSYCLKEAPFAEVLESVRHFRSELGLIVLGGYNADGRQTLIDSAGLIAENLFELNPSVYISSKKKINEKEGVTLAAIQGFTRVTLDIGDKKEDFFRQDFAPLEDFNCAVRATDSLAAAKLTSETEGCCLSAGLLSSSQANSFGLKKADLITPQKFYIAALRHPDISLSGLAARFCDAAADIAASEN